MTRCKLVYAQLGRAVGRKGHLFASAIDGVVRAVELWSNSRQQCEHPLRRFGVPTGIIRVVSRRGAAENPLSLKSVECRPSIPSTRNFFKS